MGLFLLRKCHSGNCLCSLIDWSRRMATHARVPVACSCTQAEKKKREREKEDRIKWSLIRNRDWLRLHLSRLASSPHRSSLVFEADALFEELVQLVYNETSILHRTWHSEVLGSITVKQSELAGRAGLAIFFFLFKVTWQRICRCYSQFDQLALAYP